MVTEICMFDNLNLRPSQPIEDYHSRIVDKGLRLQKSEREMIANLLTTFFVRTSAVKSFTDALHRAKLGEAYGYREITPTVAAAHPVSTSQRNDRMMKMMSSLMDRMSKLESSMGEQSSSRYQKQPHSGPRPIRAYYICSGDGHIQRECNLKNKTKNPKAKCQLCLQNGHIAGECKLYQPRSTPEVQ